MLENFVEVSDGVDSYLLRKKSRRESVICLNETAKFIIKLLKKGYSKEKILNSIQEYYNLEDQLMNSVENDYDELIKKLRNQENNEEIKKRYIEDAENDCNYNLIMKRIQNFYYDNNKPYKVFVELTYNCNLRCKHCYRQDHISKSEGINLSKEKLFKMFDDFEEAGVVEVILTGGELLLYNDIIDVLENLNNRNFIVQILTNGTLLNMDMIMKLKKYNIHDIRFSIYGMESNHDLFTGVKGSFKKTISALKLSNEILNLGTGVFVMTKDNVSDSDEIIKLFNKNNWKLSINTNITPTSEGSLDPLKYRLKLEEFNSLIKNNLVNINGSRCTAGISRFRVTPKGDISPCELLPYKFGNLNKKSFKEYIESSERKFFIELYKVMLENLSCNKCEYNSVCNICPACFFWETSKFKKGSTYNCNISRIKYSKIKETKLNEI